MQKNEQQNEKQQSSRKKWLIYVLTFILSAAYIIGGRYVAMRGYPDWTAADDTARVARVQSIIADLEIENGRQITFQAEILRGGDKGILVQTAQTIYYNYYPVQQAVSVGDKIIIYENRYSVRTGWSMLEYMRSDRLLWLGFAFAAGLLVFGRFKGFNTLVSLAFTCLAVFVVFIPSVLSGQNIYLWASITCVYVIVMTMMFINGADQKSFVAGAGCFAGVALAGIITLIMDIALKLTGMMDEDTLYLQMLDVANPIDLKGVIFASIIIGAMGAVMDVAMDIASSLNEMRLNVPEIGSRQLIRSGFNIGRDVMGTMANTLVLAYIGSSLCTTLLLVAYNITMLELLNMELIVVEILQALAGSIGILLAIPLTSLIAAAVYTRKT